MKKVNWSINNIFKLNGTSIVGGLIALGAFLAGWTGRGDWAIMSPIILAGLALMGTGKKEV